MVCSHLGKTDAVLNTFVNSAVIYTFVNSAVIYTFVNSAVLYTFVNSASKAREISVFCF